MSEELSDKYFYGKPCKNCGNTLRYSAKSQHKRCVTCTLDKRKEHFKSPENKEKRRLQRKACYKKNGGSEAIKRFYEKNREDIIKKQVQWQKNNSDKIKLSKQKAKCQYRSRKKANISIIYTTQQLKDRFSIFNDCCVYCLKSEFITIDHFIPISKGGADALYNLVPACRSCNSSKNASDPIEWMRRKGHSEAYIKNLILLIESNK